MGAGEIRSGRAVTEIAVKDTLTGSLNRISARFKSFAGGMKGIGAGLQSTFAKLAVGGVISEVFSVAGLGASIKAFASAGTELYFLSQRTGLTVKELGKLKYAAQFTGTSLDSVAVGLRGMEKFMGKVAERSGQATATLHKLGLNAAQLKQMSPDQQFEAFALAIAKVEDPTQRAALAMKVFGKSGTELVPLLEHFEELAAEAEKFGVMDQEGAEKAKKFDDSLRHLTMAFKGIFTAIASTFIGDLTASVEKIGDVVAGVRKWVKENKDLVHTIIRVGMMVGLAGAGIVAIGAGILGLGSVIGALSSIVGMVAGGFTVFMGIVGAILSPIGLVVAAVVGLGGYLLYASGAAGKAFTFIKGALGGLVNDFKGAFGAITAALQAGDINAAMAVVWSLLELEWQKGVVWIKGLWRSFCAEVASLWNDAAFGLLLVANNTWAAMQTAWNDSLSNMSNLYQDFASGVITAWKGVAGFLESSWSYLRGVFDKSFDANKAINAIEARFNAERKARGKETRGKQQAIESAQDKRNADIERQRQSGREAILGGRDDVARQAAADEAKAVAEAQAKVDKAQAAFDSAKGKANGLAPKAGYTRDYTNKKPAAAVPNLSGIIGGGTFSASVASRWRGAQPVMNRMADGIDKVAVNTKKLLNNRAAFQ